jgi:hypothetical protein
MAKHDVIQYKFPVREPDKKKDKPESELPVGEMVARALKNNSRPVTRVWVSRRDSESNFVAETGESVHIKNGVPTGQVWLFVE